MEVHDVTYSISSRCLLIRSIYMAVLSVMNTNDIYGISVFSYAKVCSISFNLRYHELASSVGSIDFTFIRKYWKQILITKAIKLLVLLFVST